MIYFTKVDGIVTKFYFDMSILSTTTQNEHENLFRIIDRFVLAILAESMHIPT